MKIIATATIENSQGSEHPDVKFNLIELDLSKPFKKYKWVDQNSKTTPTAIECIRFKSVEKAVKEMENVYNFKDWNLLIEYTN